MTRYYPTSLSRTFYIASLALSLACLTSVWIAPDEWYLAGFLALAIPFVVPWNALQTLRHWRRRSTLAWGPTAVLILSLPLVSKSLSFRVGPEPIGQTMRVMTYNTNAFQFYGDSTRYRPLLSEFQNWVASSNLDVICLQEMIEPKFEPIQVDGYQVYTSMKTTRDGNFLGPTILTKLPVVDQGKMEFAFNSYNRLMWLDVKFGEDTIRIVNVHLVSYDFNGSGLTKNIAKIRNSLRARSWHSKLIRKFLEASPHPVVLCGDLNEVAQSYPYRNLTSVLDDAFLSSGAGYVRTYSFHGFPLRIDHVLHDRNLASANYRVRTDLNWSDHWPVTVDIGRRGRAE